MTSKLTGQYFENLACNYLLNKNLELIQRNYITKYGEIDIIMRESTTVVFVEVRARKNVLYGYPIETIDYKKQAKIIKTASYFLMNNTKYETLPYRFDAVTLIGTTKTNSYQKPEDIPEKFCLTWYKNFITEDN
jgi:putative endonuclease